MLTRISTIRRKSSVQKAARSAFQRRGSWAAAGESVSPKRQKSLSASGESWCRSGVVSSSGQSFADAARWRTASRGPRGGWGGGRPGWRRRSPPLNPDLPSPGARSATPLARLARLFHPGGPARTLPLPLAGITTASQIKPRKNRLLYREGRPLPLCSFSRQASE